MENKKEKLIKALKTSINALKNDTVLYDWHQQESCNCGIVAQAITGMNRVELETAFHGQINTRLSKMGSGETKVDSTWRNAVKYLCPITGLSNVEILDKLQAAGLTKEDMVHLEYMSNPAILERGKVINKTKHEIREPFVKEIIQKTREVGHPNFFKRLLGYKVTQTYAEEILDYKVVTEEREIKHFYKEKDNLTLYLQGWLSIIQDGSQKKGIQAYDKNELEAEILVAVAEENYEGAVLLRDRLNELN